MFSAFFGIFGHISTLAHRILSFLLHRYLLHVHQNQNHQKNLGTRPLRGYYWYYWFSKFYVVLCSFMQFLVSQRAILTFQPFFCIFLYIFILQQSFLLFTAQQIFAHRCASESTKNILGLDLSGANDAKKWQKRTKNSKKPLYLKLKNNSTLLKVQSQDFC